MSTPATGSSLNLPNALTVFRIALVPVVAVLLVGDRDASVARQIATTVVFGIAAATDSLDGILARRHGQVTGFGIVADPIADKALLGTVFVGLSWLGEVSWWATVVILVREVGVTVLRFVVLRRGLIPASAGGKAKTVLQIVVAVALLLPLPPVLDPVIAVGLWAAVALTLVTGVDYVRRTVRLWQAGAPGAPE